MRTYKGILAFLVLTAMSLLLVLSFTTLGDSLANMMISALSMFFLFVTIIVLFLTRSNQEAEPVLFMGKARAPWEANKSILMISKIVTLGISAKERLSRIVLSSSIWRQDNQGVVRC